MKKLLSLLLCAVLICMPLASFAATQEDFENALTEQVYKAGISGVISLSAEKVPEYIPESVFDTKISFNGDVDMSEDLSSMKMYLNLKYTIPTIPGDASEFSQDIWYDFNEEQALCITSNDDGKYQYYDSSKIEGYSDFMTQMMNKDFINSINESTMKLLDGKLDYKISGQSAVITLSEKNLKSLGSGIAEMIKPIIDNTILDSVDMADVENVLKALGDSKIFADDAIVMNITLNDNSSISKASISLNVDTNLYDLTKKISEITGNTETDDSSEITKENSDLKASFKMEYEISELNNDFANNFPALTDDNSINILPLMVAPTDGKISVIVNNKNVVYDVEPTVVDNVLYIPLRKTLNALGVEDSAIAYEDGIVVSQISGQLVITAINSNIMAVEGENINLTSKVIETGDRTLVPIEFFNYLSTDDFTTYVNSTSPKAGANILFIMK